MPPKLPLKQRLALLGIRSGLAALNTVSSTAAASAARGLFLKPPPPPIARNVAGEGHRVELKTAGLRAVAWKYGEGPHVYLLHGWGGRAFQLSSFVKPLVAAGHTAVLLDAPGHGEAAGAESSIPAFARSLRAATQHFGPAKGVLAHSLGAMGVIVALADGLPIERVAFICPDSSLDEASKRFQKTVGLAQPAMTVLKRQLESRFHLSWADYDLARLKMTAPLRVVHDKDDDQVPLSETQELLRHWPGAQLKITEGLGHYRPLRNPEVIAELVAFVTG
jgi:pimeloyl-ACP methyl ester carboxylesterase